MSKVIHPIAGAAALLLIATFWTATVLVELAASASQIADVKRAILWGLLLLVPALAATGGTGVIRSKGRRGGLAGRKMRRMRIVAINGLLIMVPSAVFLAWRSAAGDFGITFYIVQAVELIAGAVNLRLLGLNMRDGLRMAGRLPVRRGRTA